MHSHMWSIHGCMCHLDGYVYAGYTFVIHIYVCWIYGYMCVVHGYVCCSNCAGNITATPVCAVRLGNLSVVFPAHLCIVT